MPRLKTIHITMDPELENILSEYAHEKRISKSDAFRLGFLKLLQDEKKGGK